jgi:membrane-associated protease RseP (regulator of RpoE activity)
MKRSMTFGIMSLLVLAGLSTVVLGNVPLQESSRAVVAPVPPVPPTPPAPSTLIVATGPQSGGNFMFIGRGRLGVSITDVEKDKVAELKLSGQYGALITDVNEDSPAAKAGIQKDDVVVEFDGERVRSSSHLARLVRETPAGRTVSVGLSRAGQRQDVAVEMEESKAIAEFREFSRAPRVEVRPRVRVRPNIPDVPGIGIFVSRPRLGISADELTEQLAEYFGVKQGHGVLVREVSAGSAADKAGLKAGDVIVKVNDRKLDSVSDLRKALAEEAEESEEVTLHIVRNRAEQAIKATLEKPKRREFRRQSNVWCEKGDDDNKDCDFDFDFDFDELEEGLGSLKLHLQESLEGLGEGLHRDLGPGSELHRKLEILKRKLHHEGIEREIREGGKGRSLRLRQI